MSLTLPAVSSAADIELAWQSGMAMLSAAYPRAKAYRVVVGTADRNLLSVTAPGDAVRTAVEDDDAAALKKAASFELIAHAQGKRDVPSYSGSTADREHMLDALNRAAGLSSASGPTVAGADALARAWRDAYENAPGVAAPSGGVEDAARFAATRIAGALRRGSLDGAAELESLVPELVRDADVRGLRAWAAVTEAVTSRKPLAAVLALTAAATRDVAETPAGQPTGGTVTGLERAPSLDTSASVEGTGFPSEVLARFGTLQGGRFGLAWRPDKTTADQSAERFVAPDRWIAYRAPDGTVYWLAGQGADVALADSSLDGWGYRTLSASLVDAGDTRRVVATFPSEDGR